MFLPTGLQAPGTLRSLQSRRILTAWREQLRQAGISIEREVDWDEGGRSIYFRDPAGNVVEAGPSNHMGWRLGILTQMTPPNNALQRTRPLRCDLGCFARESFFHRLRRSRST